MGARSNSTVPPTLSTYPRTLDPELLYLRWELSDRPAACTGYGRDGLLPKSFLVVRTPGTTGFTSLDIKSVTLQ